MIQKLKLKKIIVLVVTTMLITPLNSMAEKLVMSSWLPPKHPIVVEVMQPWAKQVAEVTDGRVTVRILAKPLGAPPAHFDMAADGVADITYGLHSFTNDDRFLRSRIGQFSFIGETAADASKAYWQVYSESLNAQEEHKGVKLLSLFVHGPGMFQNNKRAINTVEDFAGLKIRVPGGYIADLVTELGVTTQFMGPGEVYEKLSRGVIDGITFPAEALKSFNFAEHLTNAMKVPGGLYNTSWFFVINEKKWQDISVQDQEAIAAISGETFAQLAGEAWDRADKAGLDFAAEKGMIIETAPAMVLQDIRNKAAVYEANWSEKVKAQGYDGKAALHEMRNAAGLEN